MSQKRGEIENPKNMIGFRNVPGYRIKHKIQVQFLKSARLKLISSFPDSSVVVFIERSFLKIRTEVGIQNRKILREKVKKNDQEKSRFKQEKKTSQRP